MSDTITDKFATNVENKTPNLIGGRYELLEKLDEGGIGEVFKAKDLKFPKRPVVIKVLKKDSKSHPWKFKKFREDEHAAQSRVQHPNVAMVFDKGYLPSGEPYLVIELIDGQNLGQVITDYKTNDNQMDFHFVAEIMRQICSGVAAIHRANLIHRDLKPKNIMVFETSETDDVSFRVKIIDFGIVRDLDKSTAFGQSVGTLPYMSPEQVNGDEVTKASDIYSLGVIAYQMLTNNLPFNAKTHTQLYALQMEGVKVKPSDLCHGLPQEAERVILKALSYNENERQQSAREFGDELAKALTLKPEPMPIIVQSKPNYFKPLFAVASLAILILAIVAGWLWLGSGTKTVEAQEIAVSRPENKKPEIVPTMTNNPQVSSQTSPSSTSEKPVYDAEADFPTGKAPNGNVFAQIGLTFWRSRPATSQDDRDVARETVDTQELVSERKDEFIKNGDLFYFSIEAMVKDFLIDKSTNKFLGQNGGYVYVINREQYSDGTFGRATLIFPTLKTYNGNNLVKAGEPIILPRANGKPFRIDRSSNKQIAETYTIIISPWEFQLPATLSLDPMILPDNLVADWESKYSGKMYQANLRNGLGKAQTIREQQVGSRETIDTQEPLTQNEPLPRTVYKGAVKVGNPAMFTVSLKFKD